MASKRDKPRYVHSYRSRGKEFFYFRRAGIRTRLHGDPSMPGFWQQYTDLLRDTEPEARPGKLATIEAGTIGALIRDFKASPEWRAKGKGAQGYYVRAFRALDRIEGQPASAIGRRHVLRLRDDIAAASPTTADRFVICVRMLYAFAIDREFGVGPRRVTTNPCTGIQRVAKGKSHEAWSAAHHARFERAALPEPVRTGYMLGTYTGQRLGDIVAMPVASYDGESLRLTQAKTGRRLVIPAHEKLRSYLGTLPADGRRTFVAGQGGKALSKSHFGSLFSASVAAAGLKGMTFHGLRHSTGKRLAEVGCSAHEIQAILGHTTLANTAIYTSAASQERLAREAIRKLEGRRK